MTQVHVGQGIGVLHSRNGSMTFGNDGGFTLQTSESSGVGSRQGQTAPKAAAAPHVSVQSAYMTGAGQQFNIFGASPLLASVVQAHRGHNNVQGVGGGGGVSSSVNTEEVDGEDVVVIQAPTCQTRRYMVQGQVYDASRVTVQLQVTTDDGQTVRIPFEGKLEVTAPGAGNELRVKTTSAAVELHLGPQAHIREARSLSGRVRVTAPRATIASVSSVSGDVVVENARQVSQCRSTTGKVRHSRRPARAH